MSHYETAEQRQIREQREKIARLTREINNNNALRAADREAMLREIAAVRLQMEAEEARFRMEIERQANTVRTAKAQMSAAIKELDRDVKRREALQEQKIREMKRQHAAHMQDMKEQFQSQLQEEERKFDEKIVETRTELRQSINDLRTETDAKMQEQMQIIGDQISGVKQELQDDIRSVDAKVNTLADQIAAREQGDRDAAIYWAQEAARLLQKLKDSYRPQLFDQSKLREIENSIQRANQIISSGQYQGAIFPGMSAFYDALDLEEDLAIAEIEWNTWYTALKTREAQLLQELNDAENRVYSIESGGKTVEFTNGIDYWTYGQLTIARNNIEETRSQLTETDSMTLDELQTADASLRALQEQLALVENAAHINVAMSVRRYDIAAEIGRIVGENYQMIDFDGCFFNEEDRESYHIVFQNPNTLDRIVVVITPIPDDSGVVTNHIDLIPVANNDPVTRDQIAQIVAQKLRAFGLENCSFPCAQRFGDNTAQEATRVGNIDAVEEGLESARPSLPTGTERNAESAVNTVKRQ